MRRRLRSWKKAARIPEGGINPCLFPTRLIHPDPEEAIIFSAPKARYVSMRIRLTDLMPIPRPDLPLSRIEDYTIPPRNGNNVTTSQRRLNGELLVSRESLDARKFATNSFSFFFLLPPPFPVVSTPVTYVARKIALPPPSLPPSLSLFSKGNSALVSSW